MHRLLGVTCIPDHNLSLIITRCENAVMELVVADLFDLLVMEVEVAERFDSVVLFFGCDVPESQFGVVAASDYRALFVRVPLY